MNAIPLEEPRMPSTGDFAAELEGLVIGHLHDLNRAHAVDEANGDVLDAFIDAAVGEYIERGAARTARQEQVLRQSVATLTERRSQVQQAELESSETVSTLAAQILGLRAAIAGQRGRSGVEVFADEIDPTRVRAHAKARRKQLEEERSAVTRGLLGRSVGRLKLRRDAADNQVRARVAVVEDCEALLIEADTRLAEAVRRFRGEPPVLEGGNAHAAA